MAVKSQMYQAKSCPALGSTRAADVRMSVAAIGEGAVDGGSCWSCSVLQKRCEKRCKRATVADWSGLGGSEWP